MSELRDAHSVYRGVYDALFKAHDKYILVEIGSQNGGFDGPQFMDKRRKIAAAILKIDAELRVKLAHLDRVPAAAQSAFCLAIPERRSIGNLASRSYHQLIADLANEYVRSVEQALRFLPSGPSALKQDNPGLDDAALHSAQIAKLEGNLKPYLAARADGTRQTRQAIESLLRDAERELEHAEAAEKAGSGSREVKPATVEAPADPLRRPQRKAHQDYEFAKSKMTNTDPTDEQVYTWLRANGDSDGEQINLALATFKGYLSRARQLLGTSKTTPRTGRSGRNVAPIDEL